MVVRGAAGLQGAESRRWGMVKGIAVWVKAARGRGSRGMWKGMEDVCSVITASYQSAYTCSSRRGDQHQWGWKQCDASITDKQLSCRLHSVWLTVSHHHALLDALTSASALCC